MLPGKQLPVQRQAEEIVAKDDYANTQDSPTIFQSPQVIPLRDNILETTDLKDLQMLSASLLEWTMKKQCSFRNIIRMYHACM